MIEKSQFTQEMKVEMMENQKKVERRWGKEEEEEGEAGRRRLVLQVSIGRPHMTNFEL